MASKRIKQIRCKNTNKRKLITYRDAVCQLLNDVMSNHKKHLISLNYLMCESSNSWLSHFSSKHLNIHFPLLFGHLISLECHEIRRQFLHVRPRDLLERLKPRDRQVMRAAAELVHSSHGRVHQLEGVGLRGVFSQFNGPSVER